MKFEYSLDFIQETFTHFVNFVTKNCLGCQMSHKRSENLGFQTILRALCSFWHGQQVSGDCLGRNRISHRGMGNNIQFQVLQKVTCNKTILATLLKTVCPVTRHPCLVPFLLFNKLRLLLCSTHFKRVSSQAGADNQFFSNLSHFSSGKANVNVPILVFWQETLRSSSLISSNYTNEWVKAV